MKKRKLLPLTLICLTTLSGCEFFQSEPTRNVHFIGIGLSYIQNNSEGVHFSVSGSDYYGKSLESCPKDVKGMYEAFKSRGYDSFTTYSKSEDPYISDKDGALTDSYSLCMEALDEVAQKASSHDLTIFYYSGHGFDTGALALTDGTQNTYQYTNTTTNTTQPTLFVEGKLLPIRKLLGMLSAIPGDKLILLDSCYSGNINTEWNEGANSEFERFFSEHGDENIYILVACSDNEESFCNSQNGYFTSAVLTELESNSSITLSELYANVKESTSYPIPSEGKYYYQHATNNSSLPLDLIL